MSGIRCCAPPRTTPSDHALGTRNPRSADLGFSRSVDPHGAEPDMLRSQMLYPFSYEHRLVWPKDAATRSV